MRNEMQPCKINATMRNEMQPCNKTYLSGEYSEQWMLLVYCSVKEACCLVDGPSDHPLVFSSLDIGSCNTSKRMTSCLSVRA